MSDTLSSKHLHQLRQQRQILAMMGIGQWVQSASQTLSISDIEYAALDHTAPVMAPLISAADAGSPLDSRAPVSDSTTDANTDIDINIDTTDEQEAPQDSHLPDLTRHNADPDFQADITQTPPLLVERAQASVPDNLANNKIDSANDSVEPFDLQGGRFGDWVLIVNIKALSFDTQKLWHNITQALSITCENTAFPICAGMDSCDLANASVAGFVFKLGRSESVSVAALTPLPSGITHPNLITTPTLESMIKDSTKKREFWQQIALKPNH